MASKKRRAAKAGAGLGARVAPKVGRTAGRAAWKAGKGQARLARRAASSQEPRGLRFLKYGFFALIGLAVGTVMARSGRNGGGSDASSSFTGTTGQHSPDAGSPAGQRGETWGTGTPTTGGANRTGSERSYSDPSSGPLIGQERRGSVEGVGEQQEEVEQRIRTHIGEDPRTMDMPRVNVEVNDGIAELRGEVPSEEAKAAAGEIASSVEGVREVRNLITVS